MRAASFLTILAALCGCPAAPAPAPAAPAAAAPAAAPPAAAAAAPAAPAAACTLPAAPLSAPALLATVTALTAAGLDGRAAGRPGDDTARALVEAHFRCLGLSPAGDDGSFQQAFVDQAGRKTANVIGSLPGSDAALAAETIVVGAHHDHLGNSYPGANDNASGVAALLAAAQTLAARDPRPRRTVVFIAFGAEESDLAGSSHYVAHAPAALPIDRTVYMINLDMVGSYASKDLVYALGAFRKLPARTLLDQLTEAHADLRVVPGAAGRGSDHQPFCDLGIPYLFFWTPDATCYHKPCDEVARLDDLHMSSIATLAAELVSALADGDTDLTASRDRLGCRPK
jgi:hypothetical protein